MGCGQSLVRRSPKQGQPAAVQPHRLEVARSGPGRELLDKSSACSYHVLTLVARRQQARPSVFDFPVSGRPGGSGAVGGRGKQKIENRGGGGGPALRTRPRREKNQDLDHQISIVGFETKVPRMDLPRCPGICSGSQNR